MRIRLFEPSIHPRFDDLPWTDPLDDWDHRRIVDFPIGLHRHVVRFVDYGGQYYVIKELPQRLAEREFRLLRTMNDRGLPVVAAVALVDRRGEPEAALITRYLNYALPFRHLFQQGGGPEVADIIVESVAVLLARLHTAGFYWGDCSLSNAVFRRDGGQLAAFAVDTETGELHDRLTDGQRTLDIDTAVINIAGGLCDVEASGVDLGGVDPFDVAQRVEAEYRRFWGELHGASTYHPDDPAPLEERLERLHALGFDVREAVITDVDGKGTLQFHPARIDDGHHRRRLDDLTGIRAREQQARRLLDHIDDFRQRLAERAHQDVTLEDAAHRWLTDAFDPVLAAISPSIARKLERPQLFLEVLDHHAALERLTGRPTDLVESARSYAQGVLTGRTHERTLAPSGEI